MSTIFKTRISQQEVQAPTLSADTIVTDNFITSSIQSESVASENINATTVQGEEIIANDLSTENIAISNDLSIGQDVIVPSGNVLVGRKGIVSFVDDGEEVDENGASGFPIYNGVPEVLNNSTVYNIGEIDTDIDLSNIRFGGNDNMVQTCEIWLSTPADTTRSVGDTYEITWPENIVWLDSTDGNAPAIVKGTEYRIVLRKENEQIVASIAYAIGEGQQNVDEMIRDAAQKDGDNTFTASNTFTGSVDMSTAQVTPPEGWNVGELTAEAIQAVAPIAWHNTGINAGRASSAQSWSAAFGVEAIGSKSMDTGIGCRARAMGGYSTAIGYYTESNKPSTVTVGANFYEVVDGTGYSRTCKTEGTGSITIGAGANTLNNGDVESSNSVTIGCKAENKGADSVVVGAQASGTAAGAVVMGAGANSAYQMTVAVGKMSEVKGGNATAAGYMAKVFFNATAVGANSVASGNSICLGYDSLANQELGACAIGTSTKAYGRNSIAIGYNAKVSDLGATVIRSTAEDGTYTQLYFSGANTPLANTYHGGAPMLGYITKDSAGNIVAAGTRSLLDLLTDNSTFAPASLDENGEWVMPKVFHPSDLDLPTEEPSEPEDAEITIPDSIMNEIEEYIPLPVYPIVEPEIEEI